MPAYAPCACRNSVILLSGAMCSSFQKPRSCGLMRPSGVTAAASVKMSPAPPTARLPRWTKCQSFAKPSSLEYSHIGETTTRLGRVMEPISRGEKRCAGVFDVIALLDEQPQLRSQRRDSMATVAQNKRGFAGTKPLQTSTMLEGC